MKRERRFTNLNTARVALEQRADEGPKITGYAAVFYDGTDATQYMLWDDMAERIMPTAFDRAVKEDDVRGLFNHDPNMLLGRTTAGTMRLSVDSKGLRYEIDPPDTAVGRDTATAIKRGDLSGSSFAFVPTETLIREQDGITIREILAVELFDVGPVTFPAYESTSAGLRSEGMDDLRREVEAWRAARGMGVVRAKLAGYHARAIQVTE